MMESFGFENVFFIRNNKRLTRPSRSTSLPCDGLFVLTRFAITPALIRLFLHKFVACQSASDCADGKELGVSRDGGSNPALPFVAIAGRCESKATRSIVENLMKIADAMLIGGALLTLS